MLDKLSARCYTIITEREKGSKKSTHSKVASSQEQALPKDFYCQGEKVAGLETNLRKKYKKPLDKTGSIEYNKIIKRGTKEKKGKQNDE